MGLRLSEEKTKISHIDEGLDFLGCASSATGEEDGQALRLHLPDPGRVAIGEGQGEGDRVAERRLSRSTSSCTGSTRCCGDGRTTTATGRRPRPSPTSTPTPGGGSGWLRTNTPRQQFGTCNDATSTGGGPAGRCCALQPGHGRDHPLPLPGSTHPDAWPGDDDRNSRIAQRHETRRAGCGESRTSGSVGGPGKRTVERTTPRPGPTPSPTTGSPTAPTSRSSPGSTTTPATPCRSPPTAASPDRSSSTPSAPRRRPRHSRLDPDRQRHGVHHPLRRRARRPQRLRDRTRPPRRRPEELATEPPDHLRQSRTLPTDPEDDGSAPNPQPPPSPNSKPCSTRSSTIYNHHRPHRSLPHRATPATAYPARPKAAPATAATTPTSASATTASTRPARVTLRHNGRLHHIGIGRTHARTHVILLIARPRHPRHPRRHRRTPPRPHPRPRPPLPAHRQTPRTTPPKTTTARPQ